MFCPSCGFDGKPKEITPGSLGVGILLLFLFVLPGLIYGIWQHAGRYYGCANCGSRNIIPSDSPLAKSARSKLSSSTPTQ